MMMSLSHPTPNSLLPLALPVEGCVLRPIQPQDDEAVAQLITGTLAEFDYVEECPANDPETQHMYHYMQELTDAQYYVIEDTVTGAIVGCGGFEPLKGYNAKKEGKLVCELVKFYCSPAYRNKGLGGKLLETALLEATAQGYDAMYYEVTPRLFSKSLFERLGFYFVDDKLGNNGHTHPEINIFLVKPLKASS
jgi:N-acetylglutamate synthase-like GNAT family acetyltransferase